MGKVRTRDERYDPGGGGINVARVIRELGGEAVAFYLAGGITGQALEGLVERRGIAAVRMPIRASPASATPCSRPVPSGSSGSRPKALWSREIEWQNCLDVLSVVGADYLVASGSLVRGLPSDFYARLARQAKALGQPRGRRQLRAGPRRRAGRGRVPDQAEPGELEAPARPQDHYRRPTRRPWPASRSTPAGPRSWR